MKILFLNNKPPYPPKDGGSIASLSMIKAFANAGHHVTVLAMNTLKHHISPFELPNELTSKIIFHLVEVPAKIAPTEAFINLVNSRLPYNAQRFINKTYRHKLEVLLKATNFDVVQLEGLYLCPYIDTIRKYSNALIAYRSHNIEHEIWQRTLAHSKGLKKLYLQILTSRLKQFETDAINSYDLLVPITQRDEKMLNQMGNTKPCITIPAGIDTTNTRFEIKKPQSDDLFFIGALDWTPNQEGLFWFLDGSWPVILEKRPKSRLKIAGRNAPQWLVDKLNNYPHIDYVGEVENAARFMQENGLFIVPLLSGSGMRIKIIEGMMHQKCIVTTPIGCEGIEAINNEHIYIAKNQNDFSKIVIELLSNKEKTLATGLKASKFVKLAFDNQLLIEKLATFYKQYIK